jgi:phage FluMu protein Com
MQITFQPKSSDGECRCRKCGKLLAKIKHVDKFMVVEIKCTRAHCGLINTFEVSLNPMHSKEIDSVGGMVEFEYNPAVE